MWSDLCLGNPRAEAWKPASKLRKPFSFSFFPGSPEVTKVLNRASGVRSLGSLGSRVGSQRPGSKNGSHSFQGSLGLGCFACPKFLLPALAPWGQAAASQRGRSGGSTAWTGSRPACGSTPSTTSQPLLQPTSHSRSAAGLCLWETNCLDLHNGHSTK